MSGPGAGGASKAGRLPGRGRRLSGWLIPVMAGLGAVVLLSRSSARPAILGRYSPGYAALVLVYLAMASVAIWAARSPARWTAVTRVWKGLGLWGATAWAALVGIPLGIAVLAAEHVLARWLVPLIGVVVLGAGITFLLPAASRRALAALGRWGHGRVVTNGALVMVAVLASLVVLEVCLRIWQPLLFGRGPYVWDPAVEGFRIDNGSLSNGLGFRDANDYSIDRTGVAYRAVAIGDSFTAGTVPLDETWKHRLEARLRQAGDGRIEIINLGIAGTGPADYLRVLSTLGLRLAPDLVLVGFYAGNDFMDNAPGHQRTLVNGWPMEVRYPRWFGGLTPERFYLMTYLTRGLKPVWDAYRQRTELAQGEVREAGTYSREAFLRQRRHWIRVYERADSPWFRGQWSAVQRWLREMQQSSRSRRAEFVLALLPDQMQAEDALRREVLDHFRLDAAAYDFEKPQRLLRAFGAEAGIRVVDMLPRFRAEGHAGGLYQVRDSHWNAKGNALAADILYEYLAAEGLDSRVAAR